ncbi:MAG: hypothetical protein EB078_13660 [Proteobacteria bacterium]|nr:hypothetical protein [Pseudomonadota bacterium]
MIVTSAGKNIAPQKIENLLKTKKFINQVVVCGDKQKFLGALVTLNKEDVVKWAQTSGVSFKDYEDLLLTDKLIQMISEQVKFVNSGLASFETIKQFKILPGEFTVEAGELTPSLKLKRKVVMEKYRDHVAQLFK